MSQDTPIKSNRILVLMGLALVGLLVVAAIVIAFREPAQFEPGSPEAVTQQYLEAVLAEDGAAVHDLLTPELQQRCDVRDLDGRYYRADGERITLEESRIDGTAAVVELEFTATYSNDAFSFDRYSYVERFDLELIAGEWRISDPPWPFYWCPEE
jgi:hypothetical protein